MSPPRTNKRQPHRNIRKVGLTALFLVLFLIPSGVALQNHNATSREVVSGRGIIRYATGPIPIYHGVSMGSSPKGDEDYQRIQGWNMDCVLFEYFWAQLEDYSGGYNEANLNTLRQRVDLAKSYGFQVFLGVRVSHHGPEGGYTHDYANMDDAGRQRFADLVGMLAERFPDVGICPWFFPYHGQMEGGTLSEDRARTYYQVTFPALLAAIRTHSSQPVIFSPIHQGLAFHHGGGGVHCQTAWYRSDAPYGLTVEATWYDDPNLMWNINTHDAYNGVVQGDPWDYDEDYLEYQYSGARQFHAKYPDERLFSVEFSNLNIHGVSVPFPGADPYNIDPSRLAWVERNCQIMAELGAGWTYYGYSAHCTWDTPQLPDGSDSALAVILQKYA